VPVPRVAPEDRLLFMALPLPGLYRCVARYGYTEAVDARGEFTRAVLARVAKYSAPEAAARLLGPADQARGPLPSSQTPDEKIPFAEVRQAQLLGMQPLVSSGRSCSASAVGC
jgi:hypothetical protein